VSLPESKGRARSIGSAWECRGHGVVFGCRTPAPPWRLAQPNSFVRSFTLISQNTRSAHHRSVSTLLSNRGRPVEPRVELLVCSQQKSHRTSHPESIHRTLGEHGRRGVTLVYRIQYTACRYGRCIINRVAAGPKVRPKTRNATSAVVLAKPVVELPSASASHENSPRPLAWFTTHTYCTVQYIQPHPNGSVIFCHALSIATSESPIALVSLFWPRHQQQQIGTP
jgi:hypothetical protein